MGQLSAMEVGCKSRSWHWVDVFGAFSWQTKFSCHDCPNLCQQSVNAQPIGPQQTLCRADRHSRYGIQLFAWGVNCIRATCFQLHPICSRWVGNSYFHRHDWHISKGRATYWIWTSSYHGRCQTYPLNAPTEPRFNFGIACVLGYWMLSTGSDFTCGCNLRYGCLP